MFDVRKASEIYKKLIYILTMIYLSFIPIGSYEFIIWGMKSDILLGIILVILVFPYTFKLIHHGYQLFFCLYIFMTILIISTILSEDVNYSLYRLAVTGGYVYLSFLLPIVLKDYIDRIIKKFLYIGIIVSIYSIFLIKVFMQDTYLNSRFFFTGLSSRDFYTDPNMIGFGLGLALIPYISIVVKEKICYKNMIVNMIGAMCIFYVILSTQSRMTIFSLSVSITVVLLISLVEKLIVKDYVYLQKVICVVGLLAIITGWLVYTDSTMLSIFIERLDTNSINNSDGERWELIFKAVDGWLSNGVKVFVIGHGYYLAAKDFDPHNLFLEYAFGSGLLGLVSFVTLLIYIYFYKVKKCGSKIKFRVLSILYLYIIMGSLVYWHTKTFWFTLFFINLIYLQNNKEEKT